MRRIPQINRLEIVIVQKLDEPNWPPIVVYKMLSIDPPEKTAFTPTLLPVTRLGRCVDTILTITRSLRCVSLRFLAHPLLRK
jgi:hypothetical protein